MAEAPVKDQEAPVAAEADSTTVRVEELKRQGNEAFLAKEFQKAERLYSEAIALDGSNFYLYGNRSAARHSLGDHDNALADARKAVEIKPDWVKGYHRMAGAYASLGQFREAYHAYDEALKLDPASIWVREKLDRARVISQRHDAKVEVLDADTFKAIFRDLADLRHRMAALARLWNASTEESRHHIFSRFLAIISGPSVGVSGDDYPVSDMKELPIKNYEDIPCPDNLLKFYNELGTKEKQVELFEALFIMCSEREKTLIIQDLRFFFFQHPDDGGDGGDPTDRDGADMDGSGGEGTSVVEEGGSGVLAVAAADSSKAESKDGDAAPAAAPAAGTAGKAAAREAPEATSATSTATAL